MRPSHWHDSLLWSIRPDCRQLALDAMQKLQTLSHVDADGMDAIDFSNGPVVMNVPRGSHVRQIVRKQFEQHQRTLSSAAFGYGTPNPLEDLPIHLLDSGIAVIHIDGPIVNCSNWWYANYPDLIKSFDFCRTTPSVKSALLKFNTPGGTVNGIHECGVALDALAEEKLTVAQNAGGSYSAGYYLASRCGSICSGETDQLGNIGTVSTIYDYSEMAKLAGVRTIVKRTGPIKGMGIMGDPITPIQEEFIEHLTQTFFGYFRDAVMTGRSMDEEQFAAVSDGRWWLGAEAIDIGIIDRVSTLDETLELMRTQA